MLIGRDVESSESDDRDGRTHNSSLRKLTMVPFAIPALNRPKNKRRFHRIRQEADSAVERVAIAVLDYRRSYLAEQSIQQSKQIKEGRTFGSPVYSMQVQSDVILHSS